VGRPHGKLIARPHSKEAIRLRLVKSCAHLCQGVGNNFRSCLRISKDRYGWGGTRAKKLRGKSQDRLYSVTVLSLYRCTNYSWSIYGMKASTQDRLSDQHKVVCLTSYRRDRAMTDPWRQSTQMLDSLSRYWQGMAGQCSRMEMSYFEAMWLPYSIAFNLIMPFIALNTITSRSGR
jgi:hypothetical protein